MKHGESRIKPSSRVRDADRAWQQQQGPTWVCPLTTTSSAKRTLTGLLLRRALFSADMMDDLGFCEMDREAQSTGQSGHKGQNELGESLQPADTSHTMADHCHLKNKCEVSYCQREKKQNREKGERMRCANGRRLNGGRVFELLGRGVINASLYSPSYVAGWSHWCSPPGPWAETHTHKHTRGFITLLCPLSTKHSLSPDLCSETR